MKKVYALLIILLAGVLYVQAQTAPTDPPYKRFPTIPPFTILKPDSTTFTRDQLPKNKRTMIVYFSPDCGHCKHQMKDIFAAGDSLKNVTIVMATYEPMEELVKFSQNFKLDEHPNVFYGRDTKYFFGPFYDIKNTPHLALYDRKGNLITTYDGNQTASTIFNDFYPGK